MIGLAITSAALAQSRRKYPLSEHPIGSEVVDRIAPSEMRGMLNYMAADSRDALIEPVTTLDLAPGVISSCPTSPAAPA